MQLVLESPIRLKLYTPKPDTSDIHYYGEWKIVVKVIGQGKSRITDINLSTEHRKEVAVYSGMVLCFQTPNIKCELKRTF